MKAKRKLQKLQTGSKKDQAIDDNINITHYSSSSGTKQNPSNTKLNFKRSSFPRNIYTFESRGTGLETTNEYKQEDPQEFNILINLR